MKLKFKEKYLLKYNIHNYKEENKRVFTKGNDESTPMMNSNKMIAVQTHLMNQSKIMKLTYVLLQTTKKTR